MKTRKPANSKVQLGPSDAPSRHSRMIGIFRLDQAMAPRYLVHRRPRFKVERPRRCLSAQGAESQIEKLDLKSKYLRTNRLLITYETGETFSHKRKRAFQRKTASSAFRRLFNRSKRGKGFLPTWINSWQPREIRQPIQIGRAHV